MSVITQTDLMILSAVKSSYGTYAWDNAEKSVGSYDGRDCRAGFLGSDVYADELKNAIAFMGGRLTIMFNSTAHGSGMLDLEICIPTSSNSVATTEGWYNRSVTVAKTYTNVSRYDTIIWEGMTKEQMERIMRYGVVLRAPSNTAKIIYSVKNITYAVNYIKKDAPPVIAFVEKPDDPGFYPRADGTAVWRHKIEEPVTLGLTYTQEAGSALTGYRVWYTPLDAETETEMPTPGENVVVYDLQMPDEDGSITIPPSVWRGLTREWRKSVSQWQYARVRIWGISADSKLSNMLDMEMWIQLSPHNIDAPARDSIQTTDSAVTLTWSPPKYGYSGFCGSVPSGFRIEYSLDGGAVWSVLSDEIAADTYSYTIPAGTMRSGTFDWRIVAKYVDNTFVQPIIDQDETSRFVYKTNPTTSTVTCDGKPQPTVSWQSAEQKSYQVRFGDYDSGAVYSAAKSHVVPRFFADGNYPVQVRTQVASGEWSDWTPVLYVAIANVAPEDAVTLQTPVMDGGAVKLTWYTMYKNRFARYILYRNGVAIYDTDGAANIAGYMDKTAIGVCTYSVRGVTTGRYYAQSDTVTIDTTPTTDLLYDEEADEYIRLRYTVSAPTTVTYIRQVGVSWQYFAGRSAPVAIVDGKTERSTTQTYGSKTRELVDKIGGMVGKTVLFKDARGGGIYGVIESAQCTHGRIHSVTFTVREVDKNERIEYTVPTA